MLTLASIFALFRNRSPVNSSPCVSDIVMVLERIKAMLRDTSASRRDTVSDNHGLAAFCAMRSMQAPS